MSDPYNNPEALGLDDVIRYMEGIYELWAIRARGEDKSGTEEKANAAESGSTTPAI